MTVAFKTFGCRLNRAESLDLEARFLAAGHTVVELSTNPIPDLIVVRACSVTARAQRDCEKEIARLRTLFPTSEIRITGCLPQAQPRGTDPIQMGTDPIRTGTDPTAKGPVPMATSRAYLKVQDGCSGKCAFCIVPQFRGSPVSVPFDDVLARAQAFLDAGYREIVVTGCNLALYHSHGHGLPDLLSALAELDTTSRSPGMGSVPQYYVPCSVGMGSVPQHRVRLGSLEPGICDAALLDAFAAHANICRFIHLSVQSGSNAVLRRMNRPYRIEDVVRFCTDATARLGPRLALGADLIAGFPGETPEDHRRTREFIEGTLGCRRVGDVGDEGVATTKLVNLHVFPYSERPGTPAATMDGALPRTVRLERARELEAIGRANRAAFAATLVGKTVTVCVERGNDHGWTDEYLPCSFEGSAPRRSLIDMVVDHVVDDRLFVRA